MIEVVYRGGVYLPELDLWLDPHGARDRAFVSHAHFDHYGAHGTFVCSSETGVLAHQRFRVSKSRIEAHALREPWQEGGFEIRLLPAGHIFGSAMIHLTRLCDGATLLYTGDFKTRRGITAEAVEFLPADLLITETTFGLEKYVFPKEREIHESILRFVRSSIEDGDVPVLFGYSLGKAQEVISLIDRSGIPVVQHPTVASMSQACRDAGLALAEPIVFEKEVPPGGALVCPPNAVRSRAIRNLKNKRTAMLTGWALNPGARYRYLTDEVFALSDHADFPGLLEAVQKVGPKRVLTLHGAAKEFASFLRSRGVEAWSVFGDDQLEFGLVPTQRTEKRQDSYRPDCELQELSNLLVELESNASRLKKTELLQGYLASLGEKEIKIVSNWFDGKALGRTVKLDALHVGPAVVRQALLNATGLPLARYREISATQNDIARTTRLLLEQSPSQAKPWSILELFDLLLALASTRGSLERIEKIAEAFGRIHPQEGETLVRILTGELRVGAGEGLLEEAIAKAFEVETGAVREAHMLAGDLGQVACEARRGRLEEICFAPLSPLKVMLASPEQSAQGLVDRLGLPIWLEEKYDGIRAQFHKSGTTATLFSRDLRSLDSEFPELLDQARLLEGDFVLDGEIIAYAEGRRLSFFDLQKRLGRKKNQGDLFLGQAIPVKFLAFDLLYFNGVDLLKKPLDKRRAHLEKMTLAPMMELVEVVHASSVEEIEFAFKKAKIAGNEGLLAKDSRSFYQLGRRGKSWLKLKKAMPTLDCVVVKAQQGHGRRAGVLSDYTFALRDQKSQQLRIIGKAYSGLTDEEIEGLTEFFKETTLEKKGRVHHVEPRVVLEIAFDSLRRSKRHDSGLALRFPRIKAIRRDKDLSEIDTLEYAESLLES